VAKLHFTSRLARADLHNLILLHKPR